MKKSRTASAEERLYQEFLKREQSRRAFLRRTFGLGAAVLISGCGGSGPGPTGEDVGGGTNPGSGQPPVGGNPGNPGNPGDPSNPGQDPAPSDPMCPSSGALVGISDAATRGEAIEKAIALAGGLDFIKPGDKILLKPNCNSGDAYPYSTHPETIRKVVEMLKARGAGRIVIGDRGCSFLGGGTLGKMQSNGIADMAKQLGVELQSWDNLGSGELIKVPKDKAPSWDNAMSSGFSYPKILAEVDHIINLPCAKTHYLAFYSMSLKNLIGITTTSDRQSNIIMHTMPKLADQIAEINANVTPTLNILDITKAVVQGGPLPTDYPGGIVRDAGYVVVSRDRIATDVTGLAILKVIGSPATAINTYSCWNQPQIVSAIRLKLGITGPEQYTLCGPGVKNLEQILQKAKER